MSFSTQSSFVQILRRSSRMLTGVIVCLSLLVAISTPALAVTTTIQAYPAQVPDEEWPRGNVGDAPAGFGPDSWQGPFAGKSNWHARYAADGDYLSAMFPSDAATLTVGDLASISYFTKRPTGTPAGRDWWIQVYTRPTGSGDASSWYHDRFINNYASHTSVDTWTQYSTSGAMTFQSNALGGPVMDLATFIANHGSELIEMISIQTNSGWNGFDGYIDGLEVVLTNGEVGQVDLTTDSNTIRIAEWEVPDEERPRVNVGDAPTGFGPDSWQGPLVGKTNWHARYFNGADFLSDLFPAEAATMTVGDLASISYFTKRPTGTPAGRDWWIQVYTRPTGSGDASSWYHDRFINNYASHTSVDTWTQYSTSGAMTFQSNALGGPVMDLATFIANHGSELIEMISVQTDSGWNGFDGYIDGLEITHTNGTVGRVDFGGDCDVPSTMTLYVDKAIGTDGVSGSNPCLNPLVPCSTIQHAVDIACVAGTTINVAAGTYDEQVVITDKDVAIIGAGIGSTIIQPSVVATNTTRASDGSTPVAAIVLAEGSTGTPDVTITGVEVDGSVGAFNSCSPQYYGMYFKNAGGTVDSSRVTGVFHPSAVGCQGVVGIFASSSGAGNSADLTVTSSTVDNYGKNGITCNEYNDADTTCAITGNTVTGRGPVPSGDAAQNGIQIGYDAGGSITDNTVSGNYYDPKTWCASGILVLLSDGIDVSGNVLTGNLCDLVVTGNDGTITANEIPSAGDWPLQIFGTGNTIHQNYVNGAANEAVYANGQDNVFTCNRVTNSGAGIIFDNYGYCASWIGRCIWGDVGKTCTLHTECDIDGTPNSANENVVSGNTAGMDASSIVVLPPIDVTDNYWGCATGANTAGCDTAVGNLDFTPSATTEPVCTTCTGAGGDTDGDEICDPVDNCPDDPNVGQENADGDALGDACDVCPNDPDNDVDGDLVCGDLDNCPDDANAGQSDVDDDGLGDVCDADDGEGTLVVSRAKLRATNPGGPSAKGKVALKFLVQDDQVGNFLPNDLIANGDVVVEVTGGLFTADIAMGSACVQKNARLIKCDNGDAKGRFKLLPQGPNVFPNTYKVTVKLKKHTEEDDPLGPVTVTLRQPTTSIDRADDISDCTAKPPFGKRPASLKCRERP